MIDLDPHGHELTRFVFGRALGLIYLVAFAVAANQFRALAGEDGLLPAPRFLRRSGWKDAPSLFRLRYSDRLAGVAAWTGIGLSVVAVTGLSDAFGTPASVAVWGLLWLLYLSFVNVGQVFWAYGWESLLLETGFLAIFLGGTGVATPEVVIWLLRWVLFRVMVGAALIKLRGDECWRKLTCLDYHYETQPLPNPLSWFFHQSPRWLNRAGVGFTHFVQLVVPFGYFAPDPVRWTAGALTIAFQGTLILSGNLSWLNWLTIVLALACFDDAFFALVTGDDPGALLRGAGAALPGDLGGLVPAVEPAARALPHDVAVWVLAVGVAALSVRPVRNLFSSRQLMNATFDSLHLVNTYGAFGSVTRRRMEVVVEGTADVEIGPSTEWREYPFRGKPGDPRRMPPWVAPYHLRLDWQMWFAAMSPVHYHPWFPRFVAKLLEGDDATVALLREDPFPDGRPEHVRARLFRYEFTGPEQRRRTGRWWTRTAAGTYLPAVSRRDLRP